MELHFGDISVQDDMFLILSAAKLASMAHKNQERKYTGEPYIVHPIAVATTVYRYGGSSDMIAAAFLHDVLEDTDVPYRDIQQWTNQKVANMVNRLTDFGEGKNRKERVANYTRQLSAAWPEVQTIKCADIMDNAPCIARHDPKFADTYLAEKMAQAQAMTMADDKIRTATITMLEMLIGEEVAA